MRLASTGVGLVALAATVIGAPAAHADNKRLNDSVLANVYTVQHQAGCMNEVKSNPALRQAAEWHTTDVLNNTQLDGRLARSARGGPGRDT